MDKSNLLHMTPCFWNNFHQVNSNPKYFESQIMLKPLGAGKPKDINRRAQIG